MPSLVSLMAFMVFNNWPGWKTTTIELVTEVCKVGSVLTQRHWELGQASIRYALLKQCVPLLASHSLYQFQSMLNVLWNQSNVFNVVFNQAIPHWHWNYIKDEIPHWPWNYIVNPSQKRTKDLSFTCDRQDLCYLNFNYLIVVYFIYLMTYLITFIDSVLTLYWITQVMYNV